MQVLKCETMTLRFRIFDRVILKCNSNSLDLVNCAMIVIYNEFQAASYWKVMCWNDDWFVGSNFLKA